MFNYILFPVDLKLYYKKVALNNKSFSYLIKIISCRTHEDLQSETAGWKFMHFVLTKQTNILQKEHNLQWFLVHCIFHATSPHFPSNVSMQIERISSLLIFEGVALNINKSDMTIIYFFDQNMTIIYGLCMWSNLLVQLPNLSVETKRWEL